MIIKILQFQNRSIDGAIGYNQKKEKESLQEDIGAVLNYNQKAKSQLLAIENAVDDIDVFRRTLNEINAQGRVKYSLFHVAINFPPDEEVSDDLMLQISREYMKDMGYGEQPYAIWRHSDRLHSHVHIVSTRIDRRTFKKIYDGLENVRSTQLAAKYEQKYNLQETKHIRGRVTKSNSVGVRSRIDDVLEQVLRERPYSMQTLKQSLLTHNVQVKEGEGNRVFFVEIDDSGQEGRLFESSKLNAFSKKNVKQRLQINRAVRNKSRTLIKDSVIQLLNKYTAGIDTRRFAEELKTQGIYVRYEKNNRGIYGISFYHKGFTLKGSDVHKSLSWENLCKFIQPVEQTEQKGKVRNGKIRTPRNQRYTTSLRHRLTDLFQSSYDDNETDEDEEVENRHVPRLDE